MGKNDTENKRSQTTRHETVQATSIGGPAVTFNRSPLRIGRDNDINVQFGVGGSQLQKALKSISPSSVGVQRQSDTRLPGNTLSAPAGRATRPTGNSIAPSPPVIVQGGKDEDDEVDQGKLFTIVGGAAALLTLIMIKGK